MKLFTSRKEAEAAQQLVYETVSNIARVSGISIVQPFLSYAIRVNLEDRLVRGLPRRINGVRIIYEQVSNIRIL